jgi:hypothetical protein
MNQSKRFLCVPVCAFLWLISAGDAGAVRRGFDFACDGFRDSLVEH